MSEQEEKELISFYNNNYEFAKGKRDLFRSEIEKTKFNPSCSFSEIFKKDITQLDSMFKKAIHDIENSNEQLSYNSFMNKVDSIIQNDEKLKIKRIKQGLSQKNSPLLILKIKNNLIMAHSNCLEYILYNTDCAGFHYSIPSINTTSYTDSSGNNVVTLHSNSFQNIESNRIVSALIIDNISKDGKDFKKDYVITKNDAFADIRLKSLRKGKYKLKGKMLVYGYKGLRDYPFEHEFKVD